MMSQRAANAAEFKYGDENSMPIGIGKNHHHIVDNTTTVLCENDVNKAGHKAGGGGGHLGLKKNNVNHHNNRNSISSMTTRMKLRSSSAKQDKEKNNGAQQQQLAGKSNHANHGAGGLGTRSKRSALGDVTNRHNSSSTNNNVNMVITTQTKYNQTKSESNQPAVYKKTRVVRKAVAIEKAGGNVTEVKIDPLTSPVILKKPPATCISSNLKDMSLSKRKNLHDIDSMDKHDELCVWQYAEDINTHFLGVEKTRQPEADYMDHQSDINSKMRAILIDWLVDVHTKYGLLPQTLHLAVGLIDRYLNVDHDVKRQYLQLIGITAMFTASKYEEIYPPEVTEYCRITDNAYTIDEVFDMEAKMLKAMAFRVTCPTAYQFLQRFLKASKTDSDETISFAQYIIEFSLQEYSLMKYLPSEIAAAAVFIARVQMDELPVWNATLEYHSSYSKESILPVAQDIMEITWKYQNGITSSSKLTAVKRKYSKERFHYVSNLELKDAEDLDVY